MAEESSNQQREAAARVAVHDERKAHWYQQRQSVGYQAVAFCGDATVELYKDWISLHIRPDTDGLKEGNARDLGETLLVFADMLRRSQEAG